MRTIGVAIAVPEPHGRWLQQQRAAFGDPLAHLIPPHVTLLPPTGVTAADFATVSAHLEAVAGSTAPFDILLKSTGTFRPVSPVVFVQLERGSAECRSLEGAIRRGPLMRDIDFDYHPHVTIAHHVSDAAMDAAQVELEDYSLVFPVDAIHLYQHGADAVWRPVRAFVLEG